MTLREAKTDREMDVRPFLGLMLVLGCSRAPSPPPPSSTSAAPTQATAAPSQPTRSQIEVKAEGTPFGLRVEGGAVSFCDRRGGRMIDAATGQDGPSQRQCAKDGEANVACGGLGLDVVVSTPDLGPNDRLEVGGSVFPVTGKVHDCALHQKVIAIVTGSAVLTIDTTTERSEKLVASGGDRVAIGVGWIAWTDGATVHARRR